MSKISRESRKFNVILECHRIRVQIISSRRISRSRAICPNVSASGVFGRSEEGSWFFAEGSRKWITTAVEKTFKVNIVKIHFLLAIRFYSPPLVPVTSFSTSSFSSVAFASFARVARLCTLKYNNPSMGVPIFASIREVQSRGWE